MSIRTIFQPLRGNINLNQICRSFYDCKHNVILKFNPNFITCDTVTRCLCTQTADSLNLRNRGEIFTCTGHMMRRCASSKPVKNGNEGITNKGAEKKEFQAETKVLLEIVAKSLYSDKEVFIRELVSNASDSLEKLRYLQLSDNRDVGPLEIKISTNKIDNTLIIEDTGIGMTREELIANLGTIAKSGSKAFLEEITKKGGSQDVASVIGKFGVGFYSVFMVSNLVEVITKSHKQESYPCKWFSDGRGGYEVENIADADRGLKVIIHLKPECREFSDEERVKHIIQRYSNFINAPIFINGTQVNKVQPLWVQDPKSISSESHTEFYRLISNSFDKPRFTLHFKVDVPLSVHGLIYFPEGKPGLFELNRESTQGLALYAKRVLIRSETDNIIPKWLRFVKGVVDCEDIPLNVSREVLQNSPITSKLKDLITSRILRYLHTKSTQNETEFNQFYKDYNVFLKEGVLFSQSMQEKEEVGKLLRYESSLLPIGKTTGLTEYCKRMQKGQKKIFYLPAPSRQLAENSPYLEGLKEKKVEVLFCFEPYDEIVLMHLRSFRDFTISSVESELGKISTEDPLQSLFDGDTLAESEIKKLVTWLENKFKNTMHKITLTGKLVTHPCVITIEEMAAARHFIRTQPHLLTDPMKYSLLKPKFEINPRHPIIKKLSKLITTNPELANLVADHLHANALVTAGLIEDPRTVLVNMNRLLELALQKH